MPGDALGPPALRRAVTAALLLVGQQTAGRATRDALFLSHFDVASLPPMTAAAAALSLVAAFGFGHAMARLTPRRLLPLALGASAACFGAEAALAATLPRAAAVLLFLHQAVLGAACLSGFWSLVTESFDPHTARRAMAAIGTGASLGGVLGGVLTWQAAGRLQPPAWLLFLCVVSLLSLASVSGLGVAASGAESRVPLAVAEASGLRLLLQIPYLRALASLVVLGSFLEALLDYLLGAAATASIPRGAPLTAFFALFHTSCGLLALLAQATLVRPALARLGLAGTLAFQPAFTVIAAAAAMLYPRLAAVLTLRVGHASLRNSAFRSSYELLYTPVPPEQKRPTKVLVDVACDRAGTIAGSVAVMGLLALAPSLAPSGLLLLAGAAAVATLALAPRLHRNYVRALAANLDSGTLSLDTVSVFDATALTTLASLRLDAAPGSSSLHQPGQDAPRDAVESAIAALRSGRLERARRVLDGPPLEPVLVPHAIALLGNDPLFESAVAALRRVAVRCTGQLVDTLLDPQAEPVVRRRIPRVLRAIPTQRAADGLLLGLLDTDQFDIRYRCAQALLRLRRQEPKLVLPRDALLHAALHEAEAQDVPSRHLDCVFSILQIALPGEPFDAALRALRTSDTRLRGTALEFLENVLPAALRDTLVPRIADASQSVRSGRSQAEVRDELLRSAVALPAGPED